MCGIVGFSSTPLKQSTKLLDDMLKTLKHRGPDNSGYYSDNFFSLGNNLLSIVDVGNNKQPIIKKWQGESYVIVYNGEVYNYRELRTELKKLGHLFSTDCDTEVVLTSYIAWGEGCFAKFDGQWAFAILHINERKLLLARDPLGIKPLYYWENNNSIAFSSEPKALFDHPEIVKEPNLDSIREFFLHGFTFAAGYCLSYKSFYKGINSLEPGHYISWKKNSNVKTGKYFEIPMEKEFSGSEVNELPEVLKYVLSKSIKRSMMGNVKIGIALSGGLDSSIITAIAAKKNFEDRKGPLLASCITYNNQIENADASNAIILEKFLYKKYKINLVFSNLKTETYLQDLDKMIYHFDEPHWEMKQLAMFNNYKVLKENGAKVVLIGEGADELNFGYFYKFPGFLNPIINSSDLLIKIWKNRIKVVDPLFAEDTNDKLNELMFEAVGKFYKPYENKEFNENQRMRLWYLHTFLHWLLIDNDRCSMAHSIESRLPYLNKDVFNLSLRIPVNSQIGKKYGEEKLLLREAFKNELPEKINKRSKSPLPSPIKLEFHERIYEALMIAVNEINPSIWELLNKKMIFAFIENFGNLIYKLKHSGKSEYGGEVLTSYLHLNESYNIRTPQMFGLLTLLRWWKMNSF